ncbi:MAG: shikimate dehydrogenase [Pelagibacterales bacterium]|nr:shikimate dehydrogenase [Pelagibacterales bacterium]
MKKYLVIGNPINHSLSPKLHNHWIKENNIDAVYDKKKLHEDDLEKIISEIKNEKIHGMNVTTPFKKNIIAFVDKMTPIAEEAQSVNTVYKKNNKIIGDNTDIEGFEQSLNYINYDLENKKVFILGAGGVALSIILALKRKKVSKIYISNRTKKEPQNLKDKYSDLIIVDWGEICDFDLIINATSLGLNIDDSINLDFQNIGKEKLFYDVIYNPSKTNFLTEGKQLGNKIENGKMMFIYQAQLSFKIWHNILPKVDKETIKLLD